ncbi:AraC family transcriptional regulator [Cohnella silvisoli]|uniref:AraC family transcriptional regulator n=1 Tax=Cohnella silvisoli TaxID=2873699 RepID=A0ABV1KXU2_9BACL|nr:AraC family transcriptional regulator [Cohnella silvisoli]MCD9024185.1 AraC family transcriptional regulator [Cohnella silvisoli]
MYIRQFEQIVSEGINKDIGGGIHPFHELLYISSGEALIHWIDHTYKAKGPALFIVTPSSPHHVKQITPSLQCWFVELRLQASDYMPSLDTILAWNSMQGNLQWNGSEIAGLAATLTMIEQTLWIPHLKRTDETFRRIVSCDIQKLLFLIDHVVHIREARKNHSAPSAQLSDRWSAHNHIYDLIRYTEMYFTHEITLDKLAERSGYTPSYISRLFKEMTDLTPQQYLYELRMHAATSYLRTTKMSVQDIAEAVGYPGIHYFSRMFKKKFGDSPTEWRKTHTAD